VVQFSFIILAGITIRKDVVITDLFSETRQYYPRGNIHLNKYVILKFLAVVMKLYLRLSIKKIMHIRTLDGDEGSALCFGCLTPI
jgi:hypothetical protein